MISTTKKSQNVFAHSPSLQLLWKCASQRRFVTKNLINSTDLKTLLHDVFNYVNSKTRRRSPLALILDSHLMLGLVFVYSKTVITCHQDVEKLYKDAVVQRFFEFDVPTKTKLTRKKDAILTNAQWQIDIDENLLPDERILLERDFSIEIPRQSPPPLIGQSPPDNLPPLPWEISRPSHGKRITLLPDIEEPMPKFDLIDDRFGEPLPISAMEVDQIEPQRIAPIDDVENQFVIDALTFFNSSTDVYPIYSFENIVTKSILLGADVSSMNEVPMIVIEEPTATIHIDDDQQVQRVPVDEENRVTNEIDVRVPQDESMIKEFHMSKKKRHATNAINRKRKYPSLFNKIVQFDFETLKFLREENDQIWKRRQDEEIPWPTLIGRDGKKRMENLLEKAKTTIETSDLGIMIDDVTKIAKILTNPNETEELAQARRTGEEIAIRRGQTSGLLPRAATRPSSIAPPVEENRGAACCFSSMCRESEPKSRISQVPIGQFGEDVLPTFPSGFDEIPLPVEPARITIEPSPTSKDKQKQKAIDDLLNLNDGESFQQLLIRNQTNRIGAARLFSVLLVLCAEGRIRPIQREAFGEIQIFPNEPMENDENHF